MRRLPIPTNSLSSTCPPPVLFTIPSLDIKRSIINCSHKLHKDIQFSGDVSKTERNRRKALVEELTRRKSSGEINLMIFKSQIVPKNNTAHLRLGSPTPAPSKPICDRNLVMSSPLHVNSFVSPLPCFVCCFDKLSVDSSCEASSDPFPNDSHVHLSVFFFCWWWFKCSI